MPYVNTKLKISIQQFLITYKINWKKFGYSMVKNQNVIFYINNIIFSIGIQYDKVYRYHLISS